MGLTGRRVARITYHLTPLAWWQAAPADEPLTAPSLASEGFIHCTDGAGETRSFAPLVASVTLALRCGGLRIRPPVGGKRPADLDLIGRESAACVAPGVALVRAWIDQFSLRHLGSSSGGVLAQRRVRRTSLR